MKELAALTGSRLQLHWQEAFPDTWRPMLALARPFYSDELNFDLRPPDQNYESRLLRAVGRIAPGNPANTPLGKPLRVKSPIQVFHEHVRSVEFVPATQARHYASNIRLMIHNHIGSIHEDIAPELRPAFFGTRPGKEAFNLPRRTELAFRRSMERHAPLYAANDHFMAVIGGSISSVLFMGLHFASVADKARDFRPLVELLLSGNIPIGFSARKNEHDRLLVLCAPS